MLRSARAHLRIRRRGPTSDGAKESLDLSSSTTTSLQILPLGVLMVAGVQILSAIFLLTSPKPRRDSLAFLLGVGLGTCVGIAIWYALGNAVGINKKSGPRPGTGDWVVAGVLALAGIHAFLTRHTAKVPKWMSGLEKTEPKRAFMLGFLLMVVMPTDIAAELSTTHWVHTHHLSIWHAWPLLAITVGLLALPLLVYVLLGERRQKDMDKVRDWLTTNGWLVNVVVIIYFIYELLK